jgi:hypothetical protein
MVRNGAVSAAGTTTVSAGCVSVVTVDGAMVMGAVGMAVGAHAAINDMITSIPKLTDKTFFILPPQII